MFLLPCDVNAKEFPLVIAASVSNQQCKVFHIHGDPCSLYSPGLGFKREFFSGHMNNQGTVNKHQRNNQITFVY